MSASRPLSALRSATRAAHAGLEGRLHLARDTAGRAEYLAYCEALYGWLAALATRAAHAGVHDGRSRAWLDRMSFAAPCAWLEEDLAAFGRRARDLPRAEPRVPLATAAERCGVAYVIEGAQLGGQVLLKRLGPALAPHRPRYLIGHGADTGARWRAFLGALDAALGDDDDAIAAAAAAAATTFEDLGRWLDARGVA